MITNGLISFNVPFTFFFNVQFPGFVGNLYLVAPFWDDVDIRSDSGTISYEVHTSGPVLDTVSSYVRNQTNSTSFQGYWMIVVYWERVHQFFWASSQDVSDVY